jgi:hypothetical protein
MVGTYRLSRMCRTTSLPASFIMVQQMVPLPAISKLLAMPDRTDEGVGVRSKKSSLLLLIQQEAPVSMQMGQPPGVKFNRRGGCH